MATVSGTVCVFVCLFVCVCEGEMQKTSVILFIFLTHLHTPACNFTTQGHAQSCARANAPTLVSSFHLYPSLSRSLYGAHAVCASLLGNEEEGHRHRSSRSRIRSSRVLFITAHWPFFPPRCARILALLSVSFFHMEAEQGNLVEKPSEEIWVKTVCWI